MSFPEDTMVIEPIPEAEHVDAACEVCPQEPDAVTHRAVVHDGTLLLCGDCARQMMLALVRGVL